MDHKIKLVQTCAACPEQYDVYINGEKLGYMRLRHGNFLAEYEGETVFSCNPKGDGLFHDDERVKYLNDACRAIIAAHDAKIRAEEEPIYELEE